MAKMNLIVQLGLSIFGAIGAVYLNEEASEPDSWIPDWLRDREVGPITLTPGAQVAGGLIAALLVLPSSLPLLSSPLFRLAAASMATGAVVKEGADVLGDYVLPVLKGEKAPAPALPGPAGQPVAAGWHPGGWRVGYAQQSPYQMSHHLASLRSVAAA